MSWICGVCGLKCRESEMRCPACDARERRDLREALAQTVALADEYGAKHAGTDAGVHLAVIAAHAESSLEAAESGPSESRQPADLATNVPQASATRKEDA
jgi:predicted component of type VI protein secretion system